MTLAHPWAFALAALAAPVIAMYLYRMHRARKSVSSAILLRLIRDDRPATRNARSRLRHKVSLALVLAALVLAIIALAGPRIGGGRAARVVIIFDRSASMGARDPSARLVAASDEVSAVVDRANDGDEIALIAAGGEPGVVVAPTRSHAEVEAGAAAIVARGAIGDNSGDAIAFRLADGLCRDPDRTRIVVISDGAGLSLPPLRCPVETIGVGRPARNVGLAGLSVRSVDGLGSYDVHLALASSFTDPRNVDVTLAVAGEVVDVVRFDVPANGDIERTVRVVIDKGIDRILTAVITPVEGDALPLDDRAEVALTGSGPVSVLLVSDRPKSLVAEALRLHPRVELEIAKPDALPANRHDLIVLESSTARALPPAAHVIALGVAVKDSPLSLGDKQDKRTITRWDFDAPWFRYVDLRDVVVAKARTVSGGRSVVDCDAGPLVASALWDGREIVTTGFAIDETDLTLRAAFPNVIANFVDWAAPATQAASLHGVLSAAESHVTPRALSSTSKAQTSHDGPWFARLALIIALVLLLAEQVYSARRVA